VIFQEDQPRPGQPGQPPRPAGEGNPIRASDAADQFTPFAILIVIGV
jgi:hypothetical protein